jgi:hypothetical protein
MGEKEIQDEHTLIQFAKLYKNLKKLQLVEIFCEVTP